MGNIVLLDDLTINKIAAGEVIERPASVVKEMLENSIDAGAKNITIEIKNGGIAMIKISDDGCGIAEDDMEIAFERHATSKIRSASDLPRVMTMGFRGEALASIAAVSKVEMVSKKGDEVGHKIVVEGGKVIEFTEAARSNGTTITVQNLFYNTPVRYKFMKKDYTEAGYVEDAVTRIALVNKDVAIKLVSNGKTVLKTTGNGSLKDVIYSVYGKDISEEVNLVNYNYNNIRVTGAVGNPSIARGNRSNQLFFLNGRYIKDKNLTAAADQAFKNLVPSGRYGFLILNMEMRPDLVDINVHPAKLEVRFQDEQEAFKAIYHAIQVALEPKQTNYSDVAKKIETTDTALTSALESNLDSKVDKEPAVAASSISSDLGIGTPISGNKQIVDLKSNVKKEGKRVKKGLFSKGAVDEELENDPLAAIYQSRKKQMEAMEETDMLKVNVKNMLSEQGLAIDTIFESQTVAEAGKKSSKTPDEVDLKEKNNEDNKNSKSVNINKDNKENNDDKDSKSNIEEANNKISVTTTPETNVEEMSEADKKIKEIENKDDDDLLKESNTMSNQEKIAKFISDYHKSRHYNVEKLLKGEDEIIDETGNATEKDEKSERNAFEDTTEFISNDKELEKLTTKELDSSEVNELVKSMNKNEEILNSQVTQVIEMASKEASDNVKQNSVEYESVVEKEETAESKQTIEKEGTVESEQLIENEQSAENEQSTEEQHTEPNNVNTGDEVVISEEKKSAEESEGANPFANIVANAETVEEEDDEQEIVNPYAIDINNIYAEKPSNNNSNDSTDNNNNNRFNNNNMENTAAFETVVNKKRDTAEVDLDDLNNVSSNNSTEAANSLEEFNDDVGEVSSEDFKKKIFSKAKDELEKFTSFAGTLISAKTNSQDTQLIDTKKVREAMGEENKEAPSPETFEDSPEFAEMYKKTFGVEPFSVRKERRQKELEKEKMNATSEFTYATENMNVFDDVENVEEEEDVIPYKYIGQAFGNYIVVELKNEMYVVDISACKVRLIYEELKAKYYSEENEETKDSQVLLLPDVIILSKKEQRIAEENIEMFNNAGFIYENFGENTIKLTSVPSVCESLNTKNLFVEILDNLDTVAITDTAEKEEKFISIIASRIALGEIIEADEEQCKDMISKLLKYKNPFTSTDGKPIAIKMTKYDLDKKFSRT